MKDPPGKSRQNRTDVGSSNIPPPKRTPKEPHLDDKQTRKTRKDTEQKGEKLLQRLERQFLSQRPSQQQVAISLPPDPAAFALGRDLADTFQETFEYTDTSSLVKLRQKIVDSLKHTGIHGSVAFSFFMQFTCNQTLQQLDQWLWLSGYILQVEQEILANQSKEDRVGSGLHDTLAASLRAYAKLCSFTSRNNNSTIGDPKQYLHIMTTYRRLESAPARTILLREFAHAFPDLRGFRQCWSPLMAACVLALWSTPHSEKTIFIDQIFRITWDFVYLYGPNAQFWDMFDFLDESLEILLLVLPSAGQIFQEQLPCYLEFRYVLIMGSFSTSLISLFDVALCTDILKIAIFCS